MKKAIAFLLCTVLVLTMLTGCGSNASTSQKQPTANLASMKILYHTHNAAPYETLDPGAAYSSGDMVLQNVYETLTHYDVKSGEVVPMLASSWTSSEDGTEWVFQLREDVTFHDGTPLTAKQVVNSIQRTIDMGQDASGIWDAVETIEATGDYEVSFKCSQECAVDLAASSAYGAYIMSDSAVEKDATWFDEGNDGGSGPYMLSQATGDSVILQAYEEYRGGWNDNQFRNVILRAVPESGERRRMLEAGECQLSCEFSEEDLEALKAQTDRLYIYTAETLTEADLEKLPAGKNQLPDPNSAGHTYVISNAVDGVYGNPAYPFAVDYYEVTQKTENAA